MDLLLFQFIFFFLRGREDREGNKGEEKKKTKIKMSGTKRYYKVRLIDEENHVDLTMNIYEKNKTTWNDLIYRFLEKQEVFQVRGNIMIMIIIIIRTI